MESCLASKTNDSCSGWEARDTSLPRGSPWRKNIVAKKRCQLSCQENRTKKKTWDHHEQSNPRSSCQKVVPETQFGLHTFYILKIYFRWHRSMSKGCARDSVWITYFLYLENKMYFRWHKSVFIDPTLMPREESLSIASASLRNKSNKLQDTNLDQIL